MKRFFYIFFILALSCNEKNKEYETTDFSKGDAVFNIHIKDPNQAYLRLKSYGVYKELFLDDDGKLTDTLKNISESYFMFSDKRNGAGFYVKPGSRINVDLDTKDFIGTINYTGDLAKENNYLRDYFLLNRKLSRVNSIQYLAYLPEKDFVKTIDSIKNLRWKLLNEYDKKHSLDKHFKYLEKNRILYEWANRMETYEDYHRFAIEDTSFHVSPGYYKYRDKLDLSNENLIIVPSYHYYLENLYQKKANQLAKNDSVDVFVAYLDEVGKNIKNPKIKERLLYSYALQNLPETKDINRFYKTFKKYATDSLHIAKIRENYTELNRLKPGQPAPEFELIDDKGKIVKLSDFKGNYVYMDVWATWCRPCMAEMPYLEKLKEKYKDAKIIFVGVNVNDYKTDWLNYLKANHPKGVQLYAGNDSEFMELYQVQSVPKSILINPYGNISTANAPRPSETELIELLFDRIKNNFK